MPRVESQIATQLYYCLIKGIHRHIALLNSFLRIKHSRHTHNRHLAHFRVLHRVEELDKWNEEGIPPVVEQSE